MKPYEKNQEDFFLDKPQSSLNRVAFVSSMTNVIYANMKKKNSPGHIICKEYLFNVNVVMYFPKNFYLIRSINKKIDGFIASGIMSHLISRYVDMKYWNMKGEAKGPQKLKVEHLHGALLLWLILCAVSTVVFIMEHCVARMKTSFWKE